MNAIGKVYHLKNMRDGLPAERLKIATYHGNAFSAERDSETGELHIFHTSSSQGDPVPATTFGDRRARAATGDARARLSAPRTSISLERMLANASDARARLEGCECKRR